jgi:hypothetical protein
MVEVRVLASFINVWKELDVAEGPKSAARTVSFAPSGLAPKPLLTQGLRPGLHSFAASPLRGCAPVGFRGGGQPG